MKRAERMQDGLALKRIQAAQEIQRIATQPQLLRAHENLECYEHLARALARRAKGPPPPKSKSLWQTSARTLPRRCRNSSFSSSP
jgi:hypothetical protein